MTYYITNIHSSTRRHFQTIFGQYNQHLNISQRPKPHETFL